VVHDDIGSGSDLNDPSDLARQYGVDAVRWWLLRQTYRDSAANAFLPVARAHKELANGLGALVDRVTVMVHRYRDGQPPASAEPATDAQRLIAACGTAPEHVHTALTAADFTQATAGMWRIVEEANRHIHQVRPWELTRAECDGDVEAGRQLDAALTVLLAACRTLANQLMPFLPTLAARIAEQCFALSGSLAPPRPLYR
jgi:methionyl-tRNA synthetase